MVSRRPLDCVLSRAVETFRILLGFSAGRPCAAVIVHQCRRDGGFSLLAPSLAWFPDGRHIAATLLSGIVSVDIETGAQKRLTMMRGLNDSRPAVSPDGTTLAFIRYFASGSADIYFAGTDGSPERRLTHNETYLNNLDWTLDGREIVFGMEQNGISGLWRISAKGGAAHPIMSTPDPLWGHPIARRATGLRMSSLRLGSLSGARIFQNQTRREQALRYG